MRSTTTEVIGKILLRYNEKSEYEVEKIDWRDKEQEQIKEDEEDKVDKCLVFRLTSFPFTIEIRGKPFSSRL
jgi:hypothetical protein